ncbi:uncharacterized protein LOC132194350 isoform X2 [Neocloeon triangulifer]|uniref:uncharacterized protein LOC132194350 isoform X2 n=1 Tax=Neocloeon triangulifer TaxID=2078957 RepID=UPI00286F5513|nr:uncharacterized protein LOC132194350 isoform X2 [Neocloeon triangulifer]
MAKTSTFRGPSYRYHAKIPVTDHELYQEAFKQFQQFKYLTINKMEITIGSFVELQDDVERLQIPGSKDNLPPPKFAQIYRILETDNGPYLLVFWFHSISEGLKSLPLAPPKDRILQFPDFTTKDVILDRRRSPDFFGGVTYHQIAAVRSFVKVHFRDDPIEKLGESGMEFIHRFDVAYKNDKSILIPRLKPTDLKNDVYPVDVKKTNETLKVKCAADLAPPATIDSKSASVSGQKSSDSQKNKENVAPSTSKNKRTPVSTEDEDKNLQTRLREKVIQTRSNQKNQPDRKKHAEKPSISVESKEETEIKKLQRKCDKQKEEKIRLEVTAQLLKEKLQKTEIESTAKASSEPDKKKNKRSEQYLTHLKIISQRMARGKKKEILLIHQNFLEQDEASEVNGIGVCDDMVLVAKAECNGKLFSYAQKLATQIFKKEGAKFFSTSGRAPKGDNLNTLKFPSDYLFGFQKIVELTAKAHDITMPTKPANLKPDDDDAYKKQIREVTNRALNNWLSKLRDPFRTHCQVKSRKNNSGEPVEDKENFDESSQKSSEESSNE